MIAALVVRGAWLLELHTLPWAEQLPTDSFLYDQAARRIAQGDWLLGDRPMRMSPGYFYVLGLVHVVFGSGVWAVRALQVVAGALTVLVTWRLARKLVAPRLAIAAAGLVAFAGPLVFFDGAILPESCSTLLLTASAWAVARAIERSPSRDAGRAWGLAGLALGVLTTMRPNAVVLVPVAVWLAARYARTRRDQALRAATVALAACLAIAPITARNWVASGRFVPLTSHAGVNLYVGNGPGASGTFRVPPEVPEGGSPLTQFEAFRRAASDDAGRELDEAEADRYWQARTWAHVVAHPVDAAVLFARKVHLVFNARELGLVLPYAFSRECTSTMAAPLVQAGWLAPAALVGLLSALLGRDLAARRETRATEREPIDSSRVEPGEPSTDELARAVAALTLAFALSVAVVFVTDRYRAPLVPLFAVHAVALSAELHALVRARAWPRVTALGVALALAGVLAWPVRANQHFEREWIALGDGFLESAEPERAIEAYGEALALAPAEPLALEGLANALAFAGRTREAEDARRALLGSPDLPDAVRARVQHALDAP